MNKRNYPAAPHLAAIGLAHVDGLRIASPLTAICGTAEQLRSPAYALLSALSWV